MNDAGALHEQSLEAIVAQMADEFMERLERGERPNVDDYACRFPEHATVIRQVLASLRLVRLSSTAGTRGGDIAGDSICPEAALGDFRMVREIGRGGMGVVYEAVQLSLGRRVALKVLPFASALDARQLQRFKNEAQAAAGLHHSHIVPVYAVGVERGVHYYAMQFIQGQTLAALIADLRRLADWKDVPGWWPPKLEEPQRCHIPCASTDTPVEAHLSTMRSAHEPAYFTTVARLGVQAAHALEHAHQQGVIHRDIKPGNLLVEQASLRLWVTDFGLAHCQSQAGLTLSGDLLGTLRYMSPEQALAKHGLLDHRTDVYSLGATLYELLTLEPALRGENREKLLHRLAFDEPAPPRRLNRSVPPELETIVLKALAKDPTDRYATAQDMANDLERFLKDEPILARRPTVWKRARQWAKRHRAIVWSAGLAIVAVLAVLAGAMGWIVRDHSERQEKLTLAVRTALRQAEAYEHVHDWPKAQATAQRASVLLEQGAPDAQLRQEVRSILGELAMHEADNRLLADLDMIRSDQAKVRHEHFGLEQTLPEYEQAFARYGWHTGVPTPEEARVRLERQPASMRAIVLAALDHWSILAHFKHATEASWLDALLRVADPDPWRQALREARKRNDRPALENLASAPSVNAQPPEALRILEMSLQQRGADDAAVSLLKRAQQRFPGDFWINHDLGMALLSTHPPCAAEAVRFLTAAVAIRPSSSGAWVNLGIAFLRQGQPDEAAVAFRRATVLQPNYATAHSDLGIALMRQRHFAEAIPALRRAIYLRPDACFARLKLGEALHEEGQYVNAAKVYEKIVAMWPQNARGYFELGNVLCALDRLDQAATAYRRAILLKSSYAEAYCNLGQVLRDKGDFLASAAAYERGHKLGSRRRNWPYPSGRWVKEAQRWLQLDNALPALLEGKTEPRDAAERNGFAEVCYYKKLYVQSTRLRITAFQTAPELTEDLKAGWRTDAACAAALAASGDSVDARALDSLQRAHLREQALQWLEADLEALANRFKADAKNHTLVVNRLRTWEHLHALQSIRDPAAVAKLPADERLICQRFWNDVHKLLARTAAVK